MMLKKNTEELTLNKTTMENTIDMFTQIKEVLYESNGSSSGAIQLEKLFNSQIS